MIEVRRSEDRTAFVNFLLRRCRGELLRTGLPSELFTLEVLLSATAAFDVLELVDPKQNEIVGAVIRDQNGLLHMYVDENRRLTWDPHTTLKQALDLLLKDYRSLDAVVSRENRNMLGIMRKVGFVQTKIGREYVSCTLTKQTRRSL